MADRFLFWIGEGFLVILVVLKASGQGGKTNQRPVEGFLKKGPLGLFYWAGDNGIIKGIGDVMQKWIDERTSLLPQDGYFGTGTDQAVGKGKAFEMVPGALINKEGSLRGPQKGGGS
jgi:hypothetical protein